jgi:hypothetical protein
MARLTGADFAQLFTTFDRTAYRLETLDRYTVDDEVEPLRKFVAGEPVGSSWMASWLELIRQATSAGKQFARVRLVNNPPSDYLRFTMHCTQYNATAGEDIRFLDTDLARELGLPPYDYWLFDDSRVGRMYFTPIGEPLGTEIITDPGVVAEHIRWQTIAQRHATPYADYAQAHGLAA